MSHHYREEDPQDRLDEAERRGYLDGRAALRQRVASAYAERRGALPREKWRRKFLCEALGLPPDALEES